MTSGLTLDTGALLALERGDVRVRELLGEAAGAGVPMSSTPMWRCMPWSGGHDVVTSDPDDLRRVVPGLRLIVV